MSLESNTAKQQAMQHILNSMHIQQLRQAIVIALSSHTNMKNVTIKVINHINLILSFEQCCQVIHEVFKLGK